METQSGTAAPKAGDERKPLPGPLDGVRVLDLSRLLPGPFCSLLLADLGADVVKVEDLGAGDYSRWITPRIDGAEASVAAPHFLALNRNKRSIRIDLKQPRGRDVLLRLLESADVLLESFRPGVLERLGLGHTRLLEVNPRLVVCAITGYGQHSSIRDRAGHDLTYLAATGVLALGGEPDGPPVMPGVQIADIGGGALWAAFSILAALRYRDRTGEGQVVDVSMAHGALAWTGPLAAELLADTEWRRRGPLPLAGSIVCYRVYACADGYVALAALEEKFWHAFCAGVKREDLRDARFDRPGSDTHAALTAIFAARTRAQWRAFADEHDCCLEPVLELNEALESSLSQEMLVALEQPGAGRSLRLLGSPVGFSRSPAEPTRLPAPALGEHTDVVLEEAGFGADEIAQLHEDGAIGGRTHEQHPSILG